MFHTCWTVLCFSYIPLKPLHAEDHHRIFFLNLKYREQSRVWLQAWCWLLIRGIPERKQSARPFSWAPPVSDTVRHQPSELLISLQTWQWEGGKGAGEGQKDFKAKALKTNCSFLPAQGVHQKRPCLKQSRERKGEVEFRVLQSSSIPQDHLL